MKDPEQDCKENFRDQKQRFRTDDQKIKGHLPWNNYHHTQAGQHRTHIWPWRERESGHHNCRCPCRDRGREGRVRFVGPAIFEKRTAEHILKVVLPASDSIFKSLNRPQKYFDISVVNLDTASIMEVGLIISGFSVDIPVLLAILSAGLQMAVPRISSHGSRRLAGR